MSAADDIFDANVRHAVYLQRYSTTQVNKVLRLLEKMEPRIIGRLQRENLTALSRARNERLLDAIRKIMADTYATIKVEMRKDLRALGAYEADFQARVITSAIPVPVEVAVPAAKQIYAAANARPFQGRLLRDFLGDIETGAFQRVKQEITMGIVEGRTTAQIVRDIRGSAKQNYKDGILAISRRGAETMVRTATNHVAAVARNETYRDNADLIKGVRWVATLDGKTTAVCRARDGMVYPMDRGPRPPAHLGCRSTTTPVLKSWKELGIDLKEAPEGTRSSMNGQVPGDITYNDWLKRMDAKDPDFTDGVLGKTKAKLFRDGGLSLDKFVDASGDEYTLAELARRESAAFEKAGL